MGGWVCSGWEGTVVVECVGVCVVGGGTVVVECVGVCVVDGGGHCGC